MVRPNERRIRDESVSKNMAGSHCIILFFTRGLRDAVGPSDEEFALQGLFP